MLLLKLNDLIKVKIISRPSKICKTPYVADIQLPDDTIVQAHTASLGCCGLCEKDCIVLASPILSNSENSKSASYLKDPVTSFFGNLNNLKWKQVYKGFKEYTASIDDKDELKLIKMDPGVSVPLHSHGGKEYILVLEGSFCDEYGEYSKGDIQINDQKIKHTPIASRDTGCVCLSITEKDVIFFGKYGSFLNLFTFIKSFFKSK